MSENKTIKLTEGNVESIYKHTEDIEVALNEIVKGLFYPNYDNIMIALREIRLKLR